MTFDLEKKTKQMTRPILAQFKLWQKVVQIGPISEEISAE